jgi:DNA primase
MIDLRLAVTDQVVGDQPVKIKCREHNDKTASLAVYADNINCYGCGFHLELEGSGLPGHVDPLAYLLKVEDASDVAYKYTNESLDRYRERAAQEARRDPLPQSLATIYNAVLNTSRRHRREWFFARGLSRECINDSAVLLGHDGTRFVIPVFDKDGNLITLRYRLDPDYNDERDIAKHKYLGLKGRNGLYIYPEQLVSNLPAYPHFKGALVICEGELDALRLWEAQVPAVSVTNGAGQVEKLPAIIHEHFPFVQALYIATDQDEAGEEAAKRTAAAAEKLGYTTQRLRWKEGKDVTEALQLGQHFEL